MQPRRGRELAEPVAFQDVEHLDQDHAARGGRRHRHDGVTPIRAAHRPAQPRPIPCKVLAGHDAAGGLDGAHELLGDRSFVEGARAALRDCFECRGKIALDEPIAFCERTAIGLEEHFGGSRPARQPRLRPRQ